MTRRSENLLLCYHCEVFDVLRYNNPLFLKCSWKIVLSNCEKGDLKDRYFLIFKCIVLHLNKIAAGNSVIGCDRDGITMDKKEFIVLPDRQGGPYQR